MKSMGVATFSVAKTVRKAQKVATAFTGPCQPSPDRRPSPDLARGPSVLMGQPLPGVMHHGQRAVVIGDLTRTDINAAMAGRAARLHHALQCREPDWSTIFDWDRDQAARS